MNIFLSILLLPFVSSSVQKLENIELLSKRGFDHSSNLALLNNLNFDNARPLSGITSPTATPSIVNVGNPDAGTIPVTINTENLALGNPNAIPNGLQFTYAPAYPQNQPSVPPTLENNLFYLTGERSDASSLPYVNVLTSGFPTNYQNGVNNIQDNRNIIQPYVPQNVVEVPQNYPVQLIREVKVPQPYPVHITRTIQVPVEVRVPVEVPKPYPVKVPHSVPVPVHIRVPVIVEKPYPVQITKTVAVPVEKPVYIKVPQPIQVPVPQPYPVGVPQPVQVQVPYVVRLPEAANSVPSNLEGTQVNLVPSIPLQGAQPTVPTNLAGTQANIVPSIPLESPKIPVTPPLSELTLKSVTPATDCSICGTKVSGTSVNATSPKPSVEPVTGSGLLPPHPPLNLDPKPKGEEGLLNSYVSSKEGGVYRRGTEYQTNEYIKTW